VSKEHYFSPDPSAEKKLQTVSFRVENQTLNLSAISGTFSSTGLDKGTAVLLSLSELFPTSGDVLDLGCGWGAIATSIAKLRPNTKVWAIDVNQRSVQQTIANAKDLELTNVYALLPDELSDELLFDEIWSNPPVRIGKKELHLLLEKYLGKLKPGGRAMLVVQKQLGAPSLMRWLAESFAERKVEKVLVDRGYWVIRVTAPRSQ
jgi:16S rRNA G1207 methylase RsmC